MRRLLSARVALLASLAAVSLGACTMMPHYERPASPVPASWPPEAGGERKGGDTAGAAAAQPPLCMPA